MVHRGVAIVAWMFTVGAVVGGCIVEVDRFYDCPNPDPNHYTSGGVADPCYYIEPKFDGGGMQCDQGSVLDAGDGGDGS
jgi:hypothetical protein